MTKEEHTGTTEDFPKNLTSLNVMKWRVHLLSAQPTEVLLAIILFACILVLPPSRGNWSYRDQLGYLAEIFRGQSTHPMDVHADIVGFRRMVEKRDPYPVLGPAFKEIGVDWDVRHRQTHPPTAFLLVAPIAYLNNRTATTLWGYLILGCIFVSMLCYGFRATSAILLTALSLLWTPIILSFGNITIFWMLGLAIGYRWKETSSWASGAGIALASMTKFLPGLVIVPMVLRKRWMSILSFVEIWLFSLLIILLLHPGSISRYVSVIRLTSIGVVQRMDNASFLLNAYRFTGIPGLLFVAFFIIVTIYMNRKELLGAGSVSDRGFMLFSWLAVALLPISWVYSLAPLFPVLLYFIASKKLLPASLSLLILLFPCVKAPWGESFVWVSFVCVFLTGCLFWLDLPLFRLRVFRYKEHSPRFPCPGEKRIQQCERSTGFMGTFT
jgi:hypothetical protein